MEGCYRLIFHVLLVLAHTTLYGQVQCECNVKINSEILQLPYPQYENVTYMYEVVHDVQTDEYLEIIFNVSVDKPASAWLWGPRPLQCNCSGNAIEVINESHYEFNHTHRLLPADTSRQSMSLYSSYLDVKSDGRTLCALQIIVGSQSQTPVLKMEWRELPSVYLLQIVTVSTGFPGGFKAQHLECGVDSQVVPLIHHIGSEMLFNSSVLRDFKDKTCSVRFINYLQQVHREQIDLPVVLNSHKVLVLEAGCGDTDRVILVVVIPFTSLIVFTLLIKIKTMQNRLTKMKKGPVGPTVTINNNLGHDQSDDSSMGDVECHAPPENTCFIDNASLCSQQHLQNDGTSDLSLSFDFQNNTSDRSLSDSCGERTCTDDYLCSTYHPDTSMSVSQSYCEHVVSLIDKPGCLRNS